MLIPIQLLSVTVLGMSKFPYFLTITSPEASQPFYSRGNSLHDMWFFICHQFYSPHCFNHEYQKLFSADHIESSLTNIARPLVRSLPTDWPHCYPLPFLLPLHRIFCFPCLLFQHFLPWHCLGILHKKLDDHPHSYNISLVHYILSHHDLCHIVCTFSFLHTQLPHVHRDGGGLSYSFSE